MENFESSRRNIKVPGAGKRKPVRVSQEDLFEVRYFGPAKSLPLLVQAKVNGVKLVDWAGSNQEFIETNLLKYGALLFRNFLMRSSDEFEQFILTVSHEPLEYRERSSPRSQVSSNIYTSTDYPASQSIFLHNENSYQHNWPLKIFFWCVTPAQQGGETPIADTRKIFERIDPQIKEPFLRKKVMYIRNFGDGFGLPWQTVFQTEDRGLVETYCRNAGIKIEWKGNNRLRTTAVRQAIAKHPITGDMLWFNHATFFHISTLESTIRRALLAEFEEENLPSNTCYGDGSSIEPFVLDVLREAYRQEKVNFPWQEGDVLMLDNMLAAHGREPFVGPRRVLVGMSDPISSEGI